MREKVSPQKVRDEVSTQLLCGENVPGTTVFLDRERERERKRERERERSSYKFGRFSKLCGRLPQYAPDLLTLKVMLSKSRVTWAILPILCHHAGTTALWPQ